MFQKYTLSHEATIGVGAGLVCLSVIYLACVVWRYPWLLRFALARVLLRWGRGRWSFPASRLGAFAGGSVPFILGIMTIDSELGFLSKGAWLAILIALIAFVIGAAIYDFGLHKRRTSS